MKAAVIRSFGGPEVLRYEDVETPRPGSGHILVKILAAGVTRLDHYLREGSVTQDISFPHVLGSDAVGEVADIGEGVNGFEIGDRVVPVSGYPTEEDEYKVSPLALAPSWRLTGMGTWGTYAQFIEVPARWTLKDESGLTPVELATLPTGVRAVRVADYQWEIEQVRAGRIRPVVDRALPLREAAEAHRLIASNQVKGNLVLLPWAA